MVPEIEQIDTNDIFEVNKVRLRDGFLHIVKVTPLTAGIKFSATAKIFTEMLFLAVSNILFWELKLIFPEEAGILNGKLFLGPAIKGQVDFHHQLFLILWPRTRKKKLFIIFDWSIMRVFLNTYVGYFTDVLSKFLLYILYVGSMFSLLLVLFVRCKSFNRSLTFILYLEQV